MTFEELLQLDDKVQLEYLNSALDGAKSAEDIYVELGTDKAQMGKFGFFLVGKKFMVKPMRGYQTTKFSGNEATKFEGGKAVEKGRGAIL